MVISMLKIRRPLGRLIFNMGIAIPGKTVFLIETAPCSHQTHLSTVWTNVDEDLWCPYGITRSYKIKLPHRLWLDAISIQLALSTAICLKSYGSEAGELIYIAVQGHCYFRAYLWHGHTFFIIRGNMDIYPLASSRRYVNLNTGNSLAP